MVLGGISFHFPGQFSDGGTLKATTNREREREKAIKGLRLSAGSEGMLKEPKLNFSFAVRADRLPIHKEI